MSDWLPSLNALRAFETVARHLNYQRAADELNVTPAAVKQLVSKLELFLGATLLQRKGRGLELTAQGRRGHSDLAQAMSLVKQSVSKMRENDQETRLVVSVESSFATAWLVPRLEDFRTQHPNVTVLIDSNQAVVDLERSTTDIGIRYGVSNKSDLIVRRLFTDQVFPVCSPGFAEVSLKSQDLTALIELPLIHWDLSGMPWAAETKRWFTWDGWLKQVGASHLTTDKGLYFSDYGQALQAAVAGQGVLLASWPILREPIEAGLLLAPLPNRVTTDIGYEVVSTRQSRQRAEVSAFIDWIIKAAKSELARNS